MRVLLSTRESHGDAGPMMGGAVWLQALAAAVGMCAPPDCVAAAEGEAPAATDVLQSGGKR
jgi:hypothetical protein